MVTAKWTYILILFTALFFSGQAYAAVNATVDRYNINLDETLNLTIEVSGDDSGEPDITPLQQSFEVLSQNKSSSYSLINGAMSSKSTWFFTLRPRHAGDLIIPALNVDNKQTPAIKIKVSKTQPHQSPATSPLGDLWINMEIEPKNVHVQQQAVITLYIYQGVALNQAQLSEPQSDRAMIVRLGEDKSYQVNRDGRTWTVTERRYALFPQKHGVLKLEPVQLDGSVLAGRSYGSPFQTSRPIRVRSNALELSIEPIPASMQSKTWLPAKHLQLIENWPEGDFKVGDSITRTLTLTAVGLNSSQLPEIGILLPDHLKAYADKPVLTDAKEFDGVTGLRQEKFAILATHPGTFILPPIDIPWWNSDTQSMQIASLPARTFKVLPAPVDANQNRTDNTTPAAAPPANTKVQNNKTDIQTGTWWKWVALLTSLGWFFTIVWFYRKSTPTHQPDRANHDLKSDTSTLKKAVLEACKQNQNKACEQTLISFAKAQWPDKNINSLTSMASHCDAGLAQELIALECYLYGHQHNRQEQTWQAAPLQVAFERSNFTASTDTTGLDRKPLPSLYPE